MEIEAKIQLLGQAAQYDTCQGCGTHAHRVRDDIGRWIYPAVRPDGVRVALLKVLQSNACVNDCAYCAHRQGRDVPRSAFSPDELAHLFDNLARRGRVQGLFLSSGVGSNPGRATERMLATAELIRRRYGYPGYIHLKILPGADEASIEAAIKLAQRVSVNLEAPNARRMAALSQAKDFERTLLTPLRTAHRLRQAVGRPTSITTQFVVGAAGESDWEILATSARLYEEVRLARAYYSAFQPIRGTPLEDRPPAPAWREHRLYQADFLLRQYGFRVEEIVFDRKGDLPRHADPKLLWAQCHPEFFPVEVNTARREELLRIPGIGPQSAATILGRRKEGHLRELDHIGLGRPVEHRAAPYILLDGKRPAFQPPLWNHLAAAVAR